ncbi:uncharacterized protein si:ch211-214j24.15 [Gadus chalcogrammus]|uniref:uncharacterized protein si:ch211-214j24.15 n=1 Tax=Gadus chalcogrammus TaxID=1042646 RepID=UPI0024C2B861|nr:uncharacterized protein si:ch211-214j24.15 [Gadus chalcogrammus]
MAKQELSWEDGCKSHLKIILLGGRNSGKSVVGNLLLGKEEFVTRERTTCSKRQGVMAGRWISVVDTPGWWCDLGTRETAELVKREIASSALLCFAGPHVFLIVVKACSDFSEQRRRALEQHVALLGEAVWRHCIVLLTCVDRGEHGADEKTDNSGLQWLVKKCGQRRHRLTLPGETVGRGQVTQLCVKILKLATENADRPFEIEPSCLRRINQSIKMVEERALQRFLRTKEQRAQIQEGVRPLSDLRLVVLGATGSGKTSAVHALLGLSDAQRESSGRTARCRVHRSAHVLDRDMTVVDTPGWWRNYYALETSAFDRRELSRSVRLCPPGPHALLLVVRVDRAFTETHRRAAQEHVELLLGPAAWGHALLVFSFGDWLGDTSVERFVESEGEPLRWLVDRCGDRYHVMNNKRTGDAGFQVAELVGKVEAMVAANQGCGYLQAGGGVTDEPLLSEEEERRRRRAEQEAADQRLLLKNEQRQALRSELEMLPPTSDLRLVLLAGRNTGRTSCGDTILGRGGFHADDRAAAGAERHARVRGVAVTVVELPPPPPSSRDREREVPRGLSALLLVVNASSSFTSSLLEALEEQVMGGMRWSRAMVLFSHGDWLGDTSIEERIESEGEALRSLVQRCGNRYHVLDNRHRGDGAQVHRLLEQVEEMLLGARRALLQRGGDSIRNTVTPAVRHRQQGLAVGQRHRKIRDLGLPCTNNSSPLDCPAETSMSCRVVARPEQTRLALSIYIDMNGLASRTACPDLRDDKVLRWTLRDILAAMGILPNWSRTSSPHDRVEVLSEGRVCVSPLRLRGAEPASPSHHQRALTTAAATEEDAVAARSPWQPRDDALRKLFASGDLQALIDQWGSSSLEELEAFVDAHFEMVWERAMSSASEDDDVTERGRATGEEGAEQDEAGSSVAEGLSKLHLLEDIQREVTEMKQSLDKCWKVMLELLEAHRGGQRPAEEDSQRATRD